MTIAIASTRSTESVPLPTRWEWLARGFRKYATRYVRKHFHAVRLSRSGATLPASNVPLLVVLNHPSWWDPMIGIVLSKHFAGYDHYPAIDAVAVEKYFEMDMGRAPGIPARIDGREAHRPGIVGELRAAQECLAFRRERALLTGPGLPVVA